MRRVDRLTYKRNLHREEAYTKTFTKTDNIQRRKLYFI